MSREPIQHYARYRANRARVLAEERVCWICGRPGAPDDPLTADHVIPRSLGGSHDRSNLRAGHRSCNSSRKAGPPRPPGIRVV